ncbi:MAG: nucleotidyltransferase family protein [Pseudomonadota bacterium]
MRGISDLETLLADDPLRMDVLGLVADLGLPDCWIAAGFVRDAVWDHLHGRPIAAPQGDVDVVWFCASEPSEARDRLIEERLRCRMPGLDWSVKNQARMHSGNGGDPYSSVAHAMQHWPETATAVAARIAPSGTIEINAPLGIEDLMGLRLRPTAAFETGKKKIFLERVTAKRWVERYPLLDFSA